MLAFWIQYLYKYICVTVHLHVYIKASKIWMFDLYIYIYYILNLDDACHVYVLDWMSSLIFSWESKVPPPKATPPPNK